VTGRRRRRRKQLLEDLKEKRGYWKLKMGAQDRTVCENSVWKRLCNRAADCSMNGLVRVCSLLSVSANKSQL